MTTTTTDNIIISLNSKYGTKNNSTYLSNMTFNFNGLLTDDKQIIRKYITLISAQIPVSFYIINEYNNNLMMVFDGTTYNISLTYGNYSGSTLIAELQSQIQASISGLTVSITLNKINGCLTFSFNNTVTINASSSVGSVLGLVNDLTGSILTLSYPIDLLGTRNIYIKSQNLNISSYDSYNTNKSNVIGAVSINEAFYNMVSYISSFDITKHELKLKTLDSIDIQLTDENNNYINFNNINWTITLCLTIERLNAVVLSDNLIGTINQTQDHVPILTPEEALEEDEPTPAPLNEIRLDHKINQPTSLSGTLKTYSEALIKGSNNYPSHVIDFIKSDGDNLISNMQLIRTPVKETIVKALDFASFGKFEKSNPYDKLFHLAVVLTLDNGRKLKLEKNATINLTDNLNIKDDTESKIVNYPIENIVSLNSLLEKTRRRMGRKYFTYSSKSNNCQDFLLNVFDANIIGGQEERIFIKQDTRKIFNENPGYLKRVSNVVTGLGASFDNTKSMMSDLYKHKTDLKFLLK